MPARLALVFETKTRMSPTRAEAHTGHSSTKVVVLNGRVLLKNKVAS